VKHPPEKFGCTVCHYGQGRATNMKEAHGLGHEETHWDFPVMPLQYVQSSCVQCHDAATLKAKGWDRVARGEQLVNEKGCRGCHKLGGTGGVLGKALEGIGSKPIAYFPMGGVQGEKTTYAWLKQHFQDPRALVPTSEMRVKVTDDEADLLTTYVLALRTEEMPKLFRRLAAGNDQAPLDGEALYKKYCIACHNTGKDSLFDEVFNRTVPAIMNPALLRELDDKHLQKIVAEGRTGTQMTSWKATAAGLSDRDIDTLVAYLAKNRTGAKAQPFKVASFKADLKRGEKVFQVRCALCHGAKGEGGLGLNLRNATVQSYDPEVLAITVRDGRKDTPMPPFGKGGVGLQDQDIADAVSYVKTLAQVK